MLVVGNQALAEIEPRGWEDWQLPPQDFVTRHAVHRHAFLHLCHASWGVTPTLARVCELLGESCEQMTPEGVMTRWVAQWVLVVGSQYGWEAALGLHYPAPR